MNFIINIIIVISKSLEIYYQYYQLISIISALVGTWLLAFGLKVKSCMDEGLRKEVEKDKTLIAFSEVRQISALFYSGLSCISFASILQIMLIFK